MCGLLLSFGRRCRSQGLGMAAIVWRDETRYHILDNQIPCQFSGAVLIVENQIITIEHRSKLDDQTCKID